MKEGCYNCSKQHVCLHSGVKRFRKSCKYQNPEVKTSNWKYEGDKSVTYFEEKMKKINRAKAKGEY